MDDKEKQDIALLRYSIISPLLTNTELNDKKAEFFREVSKKIYTLPKGKTLQVSPHTIARWHRNYMRKGFDALIPKGRIDCGRPRKLDDDIKGQILHLKKEYPRLPATMIYSKLIENGTIKKNDLSLSSINRYVNHLNAQQKMTNTQDMRRYERAHINEVWCGDSSVGPYIRNGKERQKTYIIALIDDASRMIISIDIFTNDNTVNLMKVIKDGVSKYGRPQTFNFDNGKNYRNRQMNLLAARIGSVLNYCAPYTPTQKAKIERWFRTMKDHWMANLNIEDVSSLERIRESLKKYADEYNHSVHRSLDGKSPKQRFFEEQERIVRLDEKQLHDSFLLELERKVSADNVIMIDQIEYEVHYRYAKQRITLRYSSDMREVYVQDGDELVPIKLLNKQENAQIKREKVRMSTGE